MATEEKQSDDSGSLPAMQPSRGDDVKERDTAVGTPPIMISKESDENPKDGSSSLREEKVRRLEQSAARRKTKQDTNADDHSVPSSQDTNTTDGHSAPSKQKLRMAPGSAPGSVRPGAMRIGGDDKLVDDVSGREDFDMNPKDNSSAALRESKLRRLEQSDARRKTKHDTKTDDHSVPSSQHTNTDEPSKQKLRLAPGSPPEYVPPSKQKIRLAPGTAPESVQTGAMRIGFDGEVVDNVSGREDIENNLLEAEAAPDTEELVEMEVERRMQEQRQKVVVAQELTEEQHPTGDSADDVESRRKKAKRKQSIIVGIALVLIVAIGVGVWVSQSGSTDETVPTVVALPTEKPTTAAPTPAPSMAPTTLRDEVEFILADYAPLDEPTMVWLTETSSWEPDEGDPNSDYLWLERYALALLYISTKGSVRWADSSDWLSDKPVCKWSFKTSPQCDGGPITVLNLESNILIGSLPSVIFHLTALTELNLGGNQLVGTIPSSIDKLSGLVSLTLNNNSLTRSIPASIGNLSNLGQLNLIFNRLTGTIPSSIGNLNRLTYLGLSYNGVVGGATENGLSGSIPTSIGSLTQLIELYLEWNNLAGSIPSQIVKLTALRHLFLHDNNFSGSVPVLPASITWCPIDSNCFTDVANGVAAGCDVNPNCGA